MALNSYKKGSDYELKIAKILSEAFGIDLRRAPCSLDTKGDIRAAEGMSPELLEDFSIELKKQESIDIWACNRQAQEQSGGKIGVLIYTKNREDDFVSLKLDDFIKILKEVGSDWSDSCFMW